MQRTASGTAEQAAGAAQEGRDPSTRCARSLRQAQGRQDDYGSTGLTTSPRRIVREIPRCARSRKTVRDAPVETTGMQKAHKKGERATLHNMTGTRPAPATTRTFDLIQCLDAERRDSVTRTAGPPTLRLRTACGEALAISGDVTKAGDAARAAIPYLDEPWYC
jgi:hypothetical protein